MIRFALWIPLVLVVAAPFVVACDLLKKDSADAAAVAVPTAVAPVAPAVDPGATAPATGVVPVAPLGGGGGAPVTPGTAKPISDGGKAADAGAVVVTDAGKATPTPTPTPTFTIPTAIPGFDAGGFKPPPGFPTTLPTFPPPAK